MYISQDVYEASIDAIADITEIGTEVSLLIPDSDQKEKIEPVEVNEGSEDEEAVKGTIKDLYSDYYGQVQDGQPEVLKDYKINAYTTYSPSQDELIGAGLDEKCEIIVMFATYELFDNGFIEDKEGDFHSIITKLKRNVLVKHNGKLFRVKEVGMTGTLNGFSIICNLGCDLYE